jgi:Tol biopolymer transport system component
MTDERRPLTDAQIEAALARRAPGHADRAMLGTIVRLASSTPQTSASRLRWRPGGTRGRAWIGLAAAAAIVAGLLLAGVGGRNAAPTPSITPSSRPSPTTTTSASPAISYRRNGLIAIGLHLQLIDPDTRQTQPENGCHGCRIVDADWSPDGSTLVFATKADAPGGITPPQPATISVWHPGDQQARVLWACPDADCVIDQPSWSPDGRTIVFNPTTASFENSRLMTIGADGTAVRTLPMLGLRAMGFPTWTPDGRILFTASTKDSAYLAVMDADGSNESTIRELPNGGSAAMSPDGRTIATMTFTSIVPGAPDPSIEVALMDTDGSHVRAIWTHPGCCVSLPASGPEWSPDGSAIAIVAVVPEGTAAQNGIALQTIDVRTGALTIVSTTADAGQPAWQPVP